ncbi:MAG: hypothetical protein BGO07_02230 [Alphaproteobacteria bacterium 40-19]|nr:MAG: hypothetical protein BGO07_02230 [Alphaproteobacteria bacterium 40-19]
MFFFTKGRIVIKKVLTFTMFSFYDKKMNFVSTKQSLQKVFLMTLGILSPQISALKIPSAEQTKHRPFFVNLFWTTGLEGAMPEIHSFSPTPEALKDIPAVELGGGSIGSKKTFEGITEFLQAAQKKNPQVKLIFTVDKLTYWANKQGFDAVKEQFPDHFRVSFLEDFSELIKNKYPASYTLIKEYGTKFRPNMSSNCFRMLSSCTPEWLETNSSNYISTYFDVDNFVDGIQNSYAGKKNSLELMLNSKLSKNQHISTIKLLDKIPYVDTNALKFNISSTKVTQKIKPLIEKVSLFLNKCYRKKVSLDYCNYLLQFILGKSFNNKYFSKNNQNIRKIIADSFNTTMIPHYLASANKAHETKIIESPPPVRAFEWGIGTLTSGIALKMRQDPMITSFKKKHPSFTKNFLETCSVATDLLRLAPLGKWFAWQEKYFPGNTIELKKKNLTELTDCAFTRLAEIYPFAKIHSRKKGIYGKICNHIVEKLKKAYPQDLRVSTYEHTQNFSSKTSHIKKLSSPDD